MAFSLFETIQSYLSPELTQHIAGNLGESNTGVTKAMTSLMPAVLVALANRAENGDAAAMLRDARDAAGSSWMNNAASLLRTGLPGGSFSWLSNLFGTNTAPLVSAVADYSGMRESSVNTLLGMAAPLGLGLLGREANSKGWSVSQFSSFLSGQKNNFMDALPAGLGIGNLLRTDLSSTYVRPHTPEPMLRVEDKPRRSYALPVLLGLSALGLVGYLLTRGPGEGATASLPVDTTTRVANAAFAPERESMKVRLVNKVEIEAFRGGIEDVLVSCLNDATCIAGKDQWFDFDNINFETGSAVLLPSSQAQINNIVAILKAYPTARIKIGGYTDKTGDDAANRKLSQARAEALLSALKASGAPAKQLLGAEGYGSEFAKMPPSATDEERRIDRRISIQLREK